MFQRPGAALVFVALMATPPSATYGQTGPSSFAACPSQQKIDQVLGSKGQFVPDDCRWLSITAIPSQQGNVCVMRFEAKDPGVLDRLADAAVPTEWWVACEELRRP